MDITGSAKQATALTGEPHLRRVLGLWDLIFYGIVLIQPIAAIGLFGIASQVSRGHMVTTLLIAMIAMLFTAVSYGRMASLYPSAGSAYTYVGKGLNVHLGFMAGWAMFLDYLIVPVISSVYGSLTLQRLIPGVPFFVWVVLFVLIITLLNLRGIKTTARSNQILLAVMMMVIGIFIVLAIRYIFRAQGWNGLFSIKPFYNPETFQFKHIMTATSFAALTYIGFDGVTTLAEEVKNPKRNLLLATIWVCLFTGLFSVLQIYLAQQVWPDFSTFPDVETAFYDVSLKVGGNFMFNAVAAILFVACLGSGLAGQAGAARLLYAMGRDNILPKKIFAQINAKSAIPAFNIVFMGVLTVFISLSINYQSAAELLNFGAFLAFMGVNIATFRKFYLQRTNKQKHNFITDAVFPLLGFLFCLVIWISLPLPAKIMGGGWFLAGVTYLAVKTRGFKQKPVILDFKEL